MKLKKMKILMSAKLNTCVQTTLLTEWKDKLQTGKIYLQITNMIKSLHVEYIISS